MEHPYDPEVETGLEHGDDTPIAALATPFAQSALAVIRLTGRDTVHLLSGVFSRPDRLSAARDHTLHFGTLLDAGRPIDQVVVAVYRAPKSYTGQESAEVTVHGNPAGIERCLGLFYRAGFRPAEPGEFTLRAFLNGKLDLTRAEAVHELVTARTGVAHELALSRLGGAIERIIDGVKARLVHILAAVEVQLDYPEDELDDTVLPIGEIENEIEKLRRLASTYETGRIYRDGARVALAGRTNAGKSSLFNLFLREDRSIVSELHGTTRDYIESPVDIGGIPIRLFDTAGLRQSTEVIESEGIRRSSTVIESASVVLYLVDATAGLMEDDRANIAQFGSRPGFIAIWNKIDAVGAMAPQGTIPDGFLPVSAVTGEGLGPVRARIAAEIRGGAAAPGSEPVIDSIRQKQLIERCINSLRLVISGMAERTPLDAIALDLQEGIAALGEITGEVTTDEVLDAMFSGFCVGK